MDISPTTALLNDDDDDTVEGAVDYRGRPVLRSKTGGWRSAVLVLGVEVTERFAFFGIESNLITYLTGPFRQSTANAATSVNLWFGTSLMMPLLGAFIADSYLGRYTMIIASSVLYILGLGFLSLSATLPSLRPPDSCPTPGSCPAPTLFQVAFFFAALYMVALAQGGHRPCVQAFGADQFDPRHPEEIKSRSNFFNWWYFAFKAAILLSLWTVTYIQDNVSWGLGFFITAVPMAAALLVFFLGNFSFRHIVAKEQSSVSRIGLLILQSFRRKSNRVDDDDRPIRSQLPGEQKESRALLQLVAICATCIMFGAIGVQTSTLYTKQASTMIRKIGPNFEVPPASLQTFNCVASFLALPLYDFVVVPVSRSLITHEKRGLSMLQRIGLGLGMTSAVMVVAALVEARRLAAAAAAAATAGSSTTVPMSVAWLIPQYVLYGASEAVTAVGLQEFFYDQVPDGLRSVGLALYLSVFGMGNFISGFLITAIDKASGAFGESWFAADVNRGHLDYFYWLLAALNTLALGLFVYTAGFYVYRTKAGDE
ncbi:hypothetical protein H6P81_015476 [Aristolochia fimbriata]|uniref:Uncharacterized protein n=1 Tax=Aristolochia fimbriata TaxID=158543 RepID=A0AAV7E8K7_ARIFI|nr:hypothetical protein H6P81_015476 [Aristolochia fimbriata]